MPKQGDLTILLQNAWKALRFRYPQLAAVRQGNDKVYQVPDATQLEQWLKDTFIVVGDTSSGPEGFFNNLDPAPVLPVLYYFPHTSQLMFRCSHWRIDCDGAFLTMNEFYNLLVEQLQLDWGKESENLVPSFFEHLALPIEPPKDVQDYVTHMFGVFAQNIPTAGYAINGDALTKPTQTQSCSLKFTRTTTESFSEKSRYDAHTVTSAVHTAVIWSCYELAPSHLKDCPQVGLILRDQRRQFSAPLQMNSFVLDLGMTVQFFAIPKRNQSLTYSRVSELVKANYRSGFDSALHMRASNEIGKVCLAMVSAPLPEGIPPPTNPWLSSLGVVEKFLSRQHQNKSRPAQSVNIDDVKLLVDVPGPQFTVWLYSWNGQMSLQTCYNAAYYNKDNAEAILMKVKEILEQHWDMDFELVPSD